MEFQQLLSNPKRLRDLLDNSSFTGSFDAWTKRKAFIADVIHRDGTILDIGSGNGFLLRCLQEWSGRQLVPYGIDISAEFIHEAKQLFPEYADNFVLLDMKEVDGLSAVGLPAQYDFVYCSNEWSKQSVDQAKPWLERLLALVSPAGRLIVGFYSDAAVSNDHALDALQTAGVQFSGRLENPAGTNLVGWVEKP